MLDLAQGVREQIIKETAPKLAARRPFTLDALRQAAFWGACAAGALLLAVLSGRSEFGTQRLAETLRDGLYGSARPLAPTRTFDAAAETQRLGTALRGLTVESAEIKSRLTAVEQSMEDVTGSISKQIEAADAARHDEVGPSVAAVASLTTAMIAAVPPAPTVVAPPEATATLPPLAEIQSPADAATPVLTQNAQPQNAYGADIGSGFTIQALRARWEVIRSAHPELFAGLQPIISIKEAPRGNRIELRLVVGPFADAGAAAQLCVSLAPLRLFCQPTMFDGQHLALR